MTTYWPSSKIGGAPTNVGDDGVGAITLGLAFSCAQPVTYLGVRFYATGAVVGTTGFVTFVKFVGGTSTSAEILRQTTSQTLAEGWNTFLFETPVDSVSDVDGYIASIQLSRKVYTYMLDTVGSGANVALSTATSRFTGDNSHGRFYYGTVDAALSVWAASSDFTPTWFGIDVVEDENIQHAGAKDALVFADSLTAVRGGLPTQVAITGSATDTLGSSASGSLNVPVVSTSGGTRKVKRYLNRDRIIKQSIVDPVVRSGPAVTLPSQSVASEVGLAFTVDRNCALSGFRLWKAPAASGTVPVTVWDYATHAALTTMNLTWTADDGGWREYDFPAPAILTANSKYIISYYANAWVYTDWFFNGQDYVEPPFYVQPGISAATNVGAGVYLNNAHGFPAAMDSAAYRWIDPRVEWEDSLPGFGGLDYFAQWPECNWPQEFVFTVFSVDAGYVQEYVDWGINVVIPTSGFAQRDEIMAAGVPWIGAGQDGAVSAKIMALDPEYRSFHLAYYLQDEPDMYGTYVANADMLVRRNALKTYDSTKPTMVGWGIPVLEAQRFDWAPAGATPQVVNANWRAITGMVDMLSGDDYKLHYGTDEQGPWNYGRQIERLKNLGDDRLPVTLAIETCIQQGGARQPTPAEIVAAGWQVILHGGIGIIWFDHQFATNTSLGNFYPQDFQAILNSTDGRKEAVAAFMTFVKSLGKAVVSPEAGLLSAKTSSNTTAGPIGAELGVPIDTKTAIDNGFSYLFAQAARPGDTTGTFNCPTAAGKTITVLNESRTITADINGTFTDDFTGYYVTHVYRWS